MRRVFFMAVCTAVAMSVAVKTDAQQKNDSLRLINLQGVEVVATRATKTTPVAFRDISQEELKETNFGKDIPSLLQFTPSVVTSSDAGTGIGYTGIRIRGTDPTRINITSNGIPLNDSESQYLYFVDVPDFTSSVENIQVQRGVGTSTNGAGAFGASINMQTRNFSYTPFFSVDASGGSYGTHKETLNFGSGLLGNHWFMEGRLSNIGSDGYIDRASADLNSYFIQAGYFSRNTLLKFITTNGTERTYHAWDYSSKEQWKTFGRRYNPSGTYTSADGKTAYYDNQIDYFHQQHYQLLWNQSLSEAFQFNVGLHYTNNYGYYEQYKESQKLYKYLLDSENGSKTDLVRRKNIDGDFYGAVASVNYSSGKLNANLGGAWNKHDADHYGTLQWVREFKGGINPDHTYYDNNGKKIDGNIYGKVDYKIYKGLVGYVDLQYRHVNYKMTGSSQEFDDNHDQRPFAIDATYDFFNPKFGLSYQIGGGHQVYASYGIAHKEPTRNDFEDQMAESQEVMPESERLNDLEVGYKFNSRFVDFGLNFYHMDYDNQFVLTGAQDSNGEMIARNIKDSYRMGFEAELQVRPFDGFVWNLNATLSKNRAKNMSLNVVDENWNETPVNVGSTHLAYSPDFILNNIFSYEYKGWKASLMSQYVSKQYMTNSNFQSYVDEATGENISAMIDAYFVSNLDLSYSFKLKGVKRITVGATVYNLFDEKYESNGSCSMYFKQDGGKVKAFHDGDAGFWSWSTYSCQAPIHFLAHVSLNF